MKNKLLRTKNYEPRTFRAFTLIEMIVVVGVIGLVLPGIFAVVFGILRAQSRIYSLQTTKREGDFALTNIENTIKNNALGIYSDLGLATRVCDRVGNDYSSGTLYFQDKLGRAFWFAIPSGAEKVASYSAVNNTAGTDLTGSRVKVANFSLTCRTGSAFSPPLVSISYTIDFFRVTQPDDIEPLIYQTKIKLKNY